MEAIVVNKDARQDVVNREVKFCIAKIKTNAENGIATTELYVPKHIASEVRTEIEEKLTASGTSYEFCVVKRGVNEFTGKPQSYTSDTIGDDRYYKLQIF